MADKAPRLGAALAYYTIFSIAPLLLIAITVAGLIFADAQQQVVAQVQVLVGEKGAEAISAMIKAAQKPAQSAFATLFGFATLIFGAAGGFCAIERRAQHDLERARNKRPRWNRVLRKKILPLIQHGFGNRFSPSRLSFVGSWAGHGRRSHKKLYSRNGIRRTSRRRYCWL